jgi:hypothetical protein
MPIKTLYYMLRIHTVFILQLCHNKAEKLKKYKIELLYDPIFTLLDIYTKEWTSGF